MVLRECQVCGYTCGTLTAMGFHIELEHNGQAEGLVVSDEVFFKSIHEREMAKESARDRRDVPNTSAEDREMIAECVAALGSSEPGAQQAA